MKNCPRSLPISRATEQTTSVWGFRAHRSIHELRLMRVLRLLKLHGGRKLSHRSGVRVDWACAKTDSEMEGPMFYPQQSLVASNKLRRLLMAENPCRVFTFGVVSPVKKHARHIQISIIQLTVYDSCTINCSNSCIEPRYNIRSRSQKAPSLQFDLSLLLV